MTFCSSIYVRIEEGFRKLHFVSMMLLTVSVSQYLAQNLVEEIYTYSIHDRLVLQVKDDLSVLCLIPGLLLLLLSIIAQFELGWVGLKLKAGLGKYGTLIALSGSIFFLVVGSLPFGGEISPEVKIPRVIEQYKNGKTDTIGTINELWYYGQRLLASQDIDAKRDSDDVFRKIVSLSEPNHIDRLNEIANKLTSNREHASARIIYEGIASLSNLQDTETLQNTALELSKMAAKEVSTTGLESGLESNASILFNRIISLSSYSDIAKLEKIAEELEDIRAYSNAAIIREGIVSKVAQADNVSTKIKSTAQLDYGTVLVALERDEEAIDSFKQAAEYEGNKFKAHSYLCQAYDQLEQLNEAVDACDEALKIDPGNKKYERAELWYHRGLTLHKQRKYNDALNSFTFSYSIISPDARSKDTKIKEDASTVSKLTPEAISTLDPSKVADLYKLLQDKIQEYDRFMTADVVALIAASETIEGLPVMVSKPMSSNEEEEKKEKNTVVVVSEEDFPLADCGKFYREKLIDEQEQAYKLYPVFIRYNKEDADSAVNEFCRDINPNPDSIDLLVASIRGEHIATQMKDILEKRFGYARVGEPQ